MITLKHLGKEDLKMLKQIIGVYECRMLERGQYIPSSIAVTINHLTLDVEELEK